MPSSANFGRSVNYLGDINGDGFVDVAVGAEGQDNPETDEGNAFVYLGSNTGPSSSPSISLDSPTRQARARFGCSLAGADLNGDGYADVVIGAYGQNAPESGEGNVFAYFGGPAGLPTTPNATLDNPADQRGGSFGADMSAIGDVNGDGFMDVVIGARAQNAPEQNEGNAFIYYGQVTGLPGAPSVTLDNPADQAFGRFGAAVGGAGDTNGDGLSDLVIGAPQNDAAEGTAFIFLGRPELMIAPDATLNNPVEFDGGEFGASVN